MDEWSKLTTTVEQKIENGNASLTFNLNLVSTREFEPSAHIIMVEEDAQTN